MKTKKQFATIIPLDKEREDLDTVIKLSEEKEGWGTIRLEQERLVNVLTESGSSLAVIEKVSTYYNGQVEALKMMGATKMGAKIEGMIQVLISDESFIPEDHPKHGEDLVINPETEEEMDYYRTTRFLYGIHDAPPKLDWDEFRAEQEAEGKEVETPVSDTLAEEAS